LEGVGWGGACLHCQPRHHPAGADLFAPVEFAGYRLIRLVLVNAAANARIVELKG
jgi:hypothetical protein